MPASSLELPAGVLKVVLLHLGLRDLASLRSCSKALHVEIDRLGDAVWRAAAAIDPAYPRCGSSVHC